MIAVIPVAGAGKNLRPLTYTQPKPLIPVAGKPIISFIIDDLKRVGVTEFVFIIGYLGEKIRNYITDQYPELKCTFIKQENRLGSGHAILLAENKIDLSQELVIFFGDTILNFDLDKVMKSPMNYVGVKKVSDPRSFGVATIGKDGYVTSLVEKPNIPLSNLALVGFYKIKDTKALFESLKRNIDSEVKSDGEFQLTDALMGMVSQGCKIKTEIVDNWFDCGRKDILLETNALMLEKKDFQTPVVNNLNNSIIIPPVNIGEGCEINDSIIGPHVTIGNNSKLSSAIIKNSILGNFVHINEAVLFNSVIGNDTSITGLRQSLNIGDNTEIDFR
ncbi:MAG: sugar phosphate nucleotidyltransferase [Saprospiraceae bacterium]|nr:sugar phosphate nucleotidyltransferase [Saprospiraceae bacterium]